MQGGEHGRGRADEHRVLPGPEQLGARRGAGGTRQHDGLAQRVQVQLGQAVVLQEQLRASTRQYRRTLGSLAARGARPGRESSAVQRSGG